MERKRGTDKYITGAPSSLLQPHASLSLSLSLYVMVAMVYSSWLAGPLPASGNREGWLSSKSFLSVGGGTRNFRLSIRRNVRTKHGDGRDGVVACSTPPSPPSFMGGRVGRQSREGNASLLSFGVETQKNVCAEEKADVSKVLSGLLPYVVFATSGAALIYPATFSWVSKEYYAPALGGIMLSIGVQLSISDFALALKRPLPLFTGFVAQYVLKPMLGFLIARVFGAPPIFAAGFILTACVGGAQLSSYANYLGKGDVALSILLTSYTTITSVIITPLLTGLLIGSMVPVDAVAMSKSILQVVLVPVTLGLVLNTYAKSFVNAIKTIMPFVAMICTSLCIGSPLAINRDQILSGEGLRLLIPVLTFHTSAFIIGYWISKLPALRQDESACRTISLCTGMQSSTLAGLLATQFLGSTHAVPAACSVVTMAIMGLYLASFWGRGLRIVDLPSQLLSQINSTFNSSGTRSYT